MPYDKAVEICAYSDNKFAFKSSLLIFIGMKS